MSGNEIAALIVAVTGALGAIFAGVRNLRGDKFKKEVDASAALLAGYTNMVVTLQTEIDRLKSDHAEDRASFREEVARLRAEHAIQMNEAYERINELSSQVYVLQNRPPDTRERRSDTT